ncbi:MAG TPA: hypothetical protein VNL71_23795 [Chloroflexota bacterium]|nr:hypothetical protein [Chloroflexota bacterium]
MDLERVWSGMMMHIDLDMDEQEFARASAAARTAGVSIEEWVGGLIRRASQPLQPSDPLFGYLANDPELADAIDEVVAERSGRGLRAS